MFVLAPYPNIWEKVWPLTLLFDLNLIGIDNLLIKEYLCTKSEPSAVKCSWVIHYTRWGRSTWPFTLTLTCLSIRIICSSRTTYQSLNLLEQSALELSIVQGMEDKHDLWPTDLNINRDQLQTSRSLLQGQEFKNQGVFVKHYAMPPAATKSKKLFLASRSKFKVTRSLTLVSFERASLVEYACQIWSHYLLRFKSYSEG